MSERGPERQDREQERQRRLDEERRLRIELEMKRQEIHRHTEAIRELKYGMRSRVREVRAELERRHDHHKRHRKDRIRAHLRRNREQRKRHRDRHRDQRLEQMGNPQPRWYHVLAGATAFFAVFSLCWTGAHYVTKFLDRYWPYGHAHPTLRDYVSILLALFFFGMLMTLVRLIVKPEQRAANTFTMMVDAMQRMSKGDFNVNLEAHPRYAGQFAVLVDSLNRMAAELGQMEQMRQEFISNVSHEIQSPLTSIKGFAQALRTSDMPPETRDHYLQIIETESERMSRLSDNLMRLTSLESKQPVHRLRPFRLDRQIRQSVLSCEPIWDAKKLIMDVELGEVTLEGDEELLSQVWSNLLHNSIKFTPEGGTIAIRLTAEGGRAVATVADTGIGISEADLPHLFERFFKVDKSRNRQAGGSGLGLSIVRKIVDLHGGAIDAQSRLGEGTTFTVTLPLDSAAPYSASSERSE